MGVYIKGVEMPKDYGRCVCIWPDGRVTSEFGSQILATAIPVPPHGRLIDADALDESLGIEDQDIYVHWTLESAPTIIEAEEREDK